MIFGGIFKIWFGGKAKARRIGQIRLKLQNANAANDQEEVDDNAPGTDGGGDVSGQTAGTLAIDRNEDGAIERGTETSFKQDKPGALSDFEGLKSFDDNDDGLIDVNDPQFQKFGIWNDANNDTEFQPGEFQSLAALDIDSIDVSIEPVDGMLTVYKTDGSSSKLALTQTVTFT